MAHPWSARGGTGYLGTPQIAQVCPLSFDDFIVRACREDKMGNGGSSQPLMSRLRPLAVERIEAGGAPVPFSSLYEPDGAVIMVVRRMG